jgi:hypothetical protein
VRTTTLATARLTYHLSKRTAIYGAIGRMDNDGAAAVALDAGGTVGAGRTQNGVMAGCATSFNCLHVVAVARGRQPNWVLKKRVNALCEEAQALADFRHAQGGVAQQAARFAALGAQFQRGTRSAPAATGAAGSSGSSPGRRTGPAAARRRRRPALPAQQIDDGLFHAGRKQLRALQLLQLPLRVAQRVRRQRGIELGEGPVQVGRIEHQRIARLPVAGAGAEAFRMAGANRGALPRKCARKAVGTPVS